jgi:hypothetical protein
MKLNIQSEQLSPRLHFILKLMGDRLGVEWELNGPDTPHIVFGRVQDTDSKAIYFASDGVLFENEIPFSEPQVAVFKEVNVLFPDYSTMGFDLPGAAFWMLSRAEEYHPWSADNHGRFKARDSVAFKHGFSELPIVDNWFDLLKKELRHRFPDIKFREHKFELLPTFDIDSAFAFKHKGFFRTAGALVKDLLAVNFSRMAYRIRTLAGQTDPYDVYNLLEHFLDKQGLERKYFFLLSDFGRFDKNVPHKSNALRKLIMKLAEKSDIGIHPGYFSKDNPIQLGEEISRLKEILKKPITISRQHYLRMNLPETYENLIEAGIRDDYTMGWAETIGFRAGTSRPFPFFNLLKNEERPLTIHPFAVMDATLNFYLKLTPDEALNRLNVIKETLKPIGGRMLLLWHNESLSEHGEWVGYHRVFQEFVGSQSAVGVS